MRMVVPEFATTKPALQRSVAGKFVRRTGGNAHKPTTWKLKNYYALVNKSG